MSIKLYLYLIIMLMPTAAIKAQTKWLITDNLGANFVVTTTISGNKIIGETRKDALKDYVGNMKYSLIKMASKLKFPEIVHFEGAFDPSNKHKFSGIYNQLFSEGNFSGMLYPDSIVIVLLNNQNQVIKKLKGLPIGSGRNANYSQIVATILKLTEEHLYDPKFLVSKDWKNFKDKLTQNALLAEDELEIQVGFAAIAREFPFTHYQLMINNAKAANKPSNDNFLLTERNSKTAILKIKAFEGGRAIIDSLINVIAGKGYSNLIVDLRDNGGGNNETALPLINFIASTPINGGFFANRSWHEKFDRLPSTADDQFFNVFNKGTLDEFYRLTETGYGVYIKSVPAAKHFAGKVYVLTNQRTASTSEILVMGLKENNLATIVGKKTAGAALSGKAFKIDERFSVFIPIAEYVSSKGYVIDKRGIEPDVIVKTGDELEYILMNIN